MVPFAWFAPPNGGDTITFPRSREGTVSAVFGPGKETAP